MKEFFKNIRENPELKSKLIKASIFFGVFLIGVIVFVVFQSSKKEDDSINQQKENQINGRIVPADTTAITAYKNDFYMKQKSDSVTIQKSSAENVLGGSMTNQNQNKEENDAVLNNYLNKRQQSIDRMQSSGSSSQQTYSRRSYNPSGNSSDWTSERTVVNSSKVSYNNRNYNPDNPSGSLTSNLNNQQSPNYNSQQQEKPLTKEEKLQRAISSKYSQSATNNQIVAEIYGSQKITSNNSSVRIVLKEKINLGDVVIGTDAFVYGVASINQNNVMISIPSISYKGKNYQVNLVAYDYTTGELGIPIRNDNIVGAVEKQAENQAQQEISRYGGKVGSVVSAIISGRNRNVSIQLNEGHRIYLKSK